MRKYLPRIVRNSRHSYEDFAIIPLLINEELNTHQSLTAADLREKYQVNNNNPSISCIIDYFYCLRLQSIISNEKYL